ncbi:MAG: dienelactone hydrolase family protein [Rhodobacteraceae bacterium]|nr:dienelactone hydrolase family protein [Paracoccaceae bacterium]
MDFLEGFEVYEFDGPLEDGNRVTHPVYFLGEGPPIIIWQELPGIGPETIALAKKIVASGYRIYLPHLFGPLGRLSFAGNIGRLFCMRREFHLFAANMASPIAAWMAALCRDVRDRNEGQMVGTLGMCLTGGFALTLMADEAVIGGVASQPSLPLGRQSALHMSADQIAAAKAGMQAKGPAMAMRYDGDVLCKAVKLDAIEQAFGDGVVTHTIPGRGHATLTVHWSEEAWEHMIGYFDERFGRSA